MNNFLLDFISLLAILSSVLVITSKNPVISVIFLIFLFINTAIYLIMLGISFVGISYIIIYIGAITVLFLFIIMMLNIRILDILEIGKEYTKNLPLAIIVGSLFIFEIFSVIPFSLNNVSILNLTLELFNYISDFILFSYEFSFNFFINFVSHYIYPVKLMSYMPDNSIIELSQISSLGQGLYTYGSIWLILCSLILLLSMVSAIIISQNAEE